MISFEAGIPMVKQNTALVLNFNNSNTSFSDSTGNLMSCTNALFIANREGSIMQGGENLLPGEPLAGGWVNQNIMALPTNSEKHVYVYVNHEILPVISHSATKMLTANVDMQKNAGLGGVTSHNQIILADTLATGGVISAVKHANGRDWWILANEINTNRYYRILSTPMGFEILGSQTVGDSISLGVGQVCFSPDGTHFANYYGISTSQGGYLEIYDFDRCSGLLSNHRSKHIPDGSWGGIAFSPNSRYLYFNNSFKAYQFDFEAPDVLASQTLIAEWDGFMAPFATRFYLMQLAPDGKIYAATTTGCQVLHVIHQPNEAGTACQYEQHGIWLPTYNAHSMPCFPNYRLGPLDGSACDTLGLDNRPVAWFRTDRDTLDLLTAAFHDLSYYEPTQWDWDFGDGTGSTERHPAHTYAQAGTYEVCLTVSNTNSSHTFCRTLFFGVSALHDPEIQAAIQVAPNPFTHYLGISLSTPLRGPVFELFDLTGRKVAEQSLAYGLTTVDGLAHLPQGFYFWQVMAGGQVVRNGKVVKSGE